MPADIRPKDARGNATAPQENLGPATDHTRGHWRSAIIFAAREKLGLRYRFDGGEILAHLMREHPNFGAALRELLDELAEQEARSGRSDGMERGCVRRAEEVARFYQHEARAEMKRRDAINHKPERTAALPLTSDTAASAQERET